MKKPVIRLCTWAGLAAALVLLASPAHAQYRPRPLNDPATGEKYHIEAAADLWFPTADITVASESLGIAGTSIDFKQDLGLTDKRLPALHLVLRPAKKHKFRAQSIPIRYESTSTIKRDVVFNGIKYRVGVPVNSTLDWKAYRFGYEYDFVSTNKGFGGLILEAKYTDVQVDLDSPQIAHEFAHARAPIPALGGIVRVYVVPNIAITGEFTGFYWPDKAVASINGQAHYYDFDVSSTLNFSNNIGVQAGYRSLDVSYRVVSDAGSFVLKGLYVGAVLRY